MNSAVCIFRKHAVKKLIIAVGLVLLLASAVLAGDTPLLPVKLMTHRGLTSQAPENSLAALEAAWRAGLHGAEIDVRTAKDGVLVLMHDATLLRTTNGSGMVEHTVWQSLQKLRLKGSRSGLSSQGIPSLDQALAWAAKRPGFKLALDLKQADPVAVGKLVVKHGLMSRVDLYVGGPERAGLIRKIKAYNPALRVSLNLGWWWKVEGLAAFAAKGAGADALFAAQWNFPARGFSEARKAGAEVQVYVWGNDNLPDRLRKAAAMGAQVFSCDYPLQLLPMVMPRNDLKQVNK